MSRESLFFKNVKLHKSMSYMKKEDIEHVKEIRHKFKQDLLKKQKDKKEFIKTHNNISNLLLRWLFGLNC